MRRGGWTFVRICESFDLIFAGVQFGTGDKALGLSLLFAALALMFFEERGRR